jgi:hypothetical protein
VYYRDGKGGPADPLSSYFWFSLARARLQGSGRARQHDEPLLTPEQLAEAERRLAQWKPVKP